MSTAAQQPLRRVARRAVADDRAPRVEAGVPLTAGERRAWFLSRWAPGVDRTVALCRVTDPAGLPARLAALPPSDRYLETPAGPVRLPAVPPGTPAPAPPAAPDGPAPAGAVLVRSEARDARELGREALVVPLDPGAGVLVRVLLAGDLLAVAAHRLAADPAAAEALADHLATGTLAGPGRPATGAPAGTGPDRAVSATRPGPDPAAGADPGAGAAAGADAAAEAERVRGAEGVSLPVDFRAPDTRTWATATVTRELPAAPLLDELVAALAGVLARYTGRTDLALGTVLPVPNERLGNPVVLRLDLAGDPTAADLRDRARAALAAGRARTVPFDRMVAALAPARDPAAHPVFRVLVEVRDRSAGALPAPAGAALPDLAVRAVRYPDRAELVADYAAELFTPDRVARLLDHLVELAADAAARPGRRLGDLALLTPAELARIEDWNATSTPYAGDERCLHEVVREWAVRTPDAPAARDRGAALTYRELIDAADRLSARLRVLGTGPEDLVAVVVDRGFDLPVSLLGVLGAGAGYLPLDPSHPPERLAAQIADAGCPAIVADPHFADRLPAGPAVLRPDGTVLAAGPRRPVRDAAPTPDNVAYVIFTSGSTGRPKGTVVAHRSVVNYVLHCRDLFGLGPGDRVLQFANPCFDVSVFDVFCTLGNGATLVHAPKATLVDPRALTALLVAEQVTMADLPPAIPALLDPAELPELRRLSLGGESVPGELVRRWRTPDRAVYNIYGPTEATVTCTDHLCPLDGSAEDPTIGGPIANLTAYVVDAYGQHAPVGVPGELLIGGVGVTRGYLKRPGLTADRFVPDPFGPPGARAYRTGDLVARREDGLLQFVGRVDRQVKLRGQRIEPGEVEAALRPHPHVESAAVLARGGDLVAYLVPEPGRTAPDLGTVRAFLRDRLPGYLIPSAVVALPAFPLTSNGKVDLRALPDPRPAAAAVAAMPAGPVQAALAGLWARLIGGGPDEDFFARGGESLRALDLLRQVRETTGVTVEPPVFWADPTLTALTRRVRASA